VIGYGQGDSFRFGEFRTVTGIVPVPAVRDVAPVFELHDIGPIPTRSNWSAHSFHAHFCSRLSSGRGQVTVHREDWARDLGRPLARSDISGFFRHAAQQGYFDGANPVKLAEIPAFAPRGAETRPYSLEEVGAMLRVLPEPSATSVATAAFTGLRLGELRGLMWESYQPAENDESLGSLNITRSVWRNTVGDPKTENSKAPVPVIPQLAKRLEAHRKRCGNPTSGPIFANSAGHPLDLNACYQREMKHVLKRAGISWHGWHGFRRGLPSNLNRLGIDDSVIQRILRHSNVATTQNHYIKTASPDAIAAMRQFAEALLCSTCAPDQAINSRSTVQ